MAEKPRGLFIVGADTNVGKTYVGAIVARELAAAGHRVGVYKPAASGCRREGDTLVSDDALALWNAAGRPGTLDEVCPQRFAAALAPHLAAREEGREIDRDLLRSGLDVWLARSDVMLIEGVGGLMSPIGDNEYVADLAHDFGYPLLLVTRNALGTINHTMMTIITAATYREGLRVAGIVLNQPQPPGDDVSIGSNRKVLADAFQTPPLLGEVTWQAESLDAPVDWYNVAARE